MHSPALPVVPTCVKGIPTFAYSTLLPLTTADIAAGAAIFLVGEILLSRLLYRARIREEPF